MKLTLPSREKPVPGPLDPGIYDWRYKVETVMNRLSNKLQKAVIPDESLLKRLKFVAMAFFLH